MDELSVAVPTKGIQYNFLCKCWLAKDRGDGLTARVFNILDATTISIIRKVQCELLGHVHRIEIWTFTLSARVYGTRLAPEIGMILCAL